MKYNGLEIQDGKLVLNVPDRLKQQLLWAFDDRCRLDPDMFISILDHENFRISPHDATDLAEEIQGWAAILYFQRGRVITITA